MVSLFAIFGVVWVMSTTVLDVIRGLHGCVDV